MDGTPTGASRTTRPLDLRRWAHLKADRLLGWGLVVLGLIILVVGWIGVSGAAYVAQQLPYIMSAGIGGVFALGLGAALLLSSDLRDEWCKLDEIQAELRQLREAGVIVPAVGVVDVHGGDVNGGLVETPAPRQRSRRSRSTGSRSG